MTLNEVKAELIRRANVEQQKHVQNAEQQKAIARRSEHARQVQNDARNVRRSIRRGGCFRRFAA